MVSPALTGAATSAFARTIAGDPAVDSAVYDLRLLGVVGLPAHRFAAVSRDGIFGLFRDPDAAALAVANRRGFGPGSITLDPSDGIILPGGTR